MQTFTSFSELADHYRLEERREHVRPGQARGSRDD